jgi:hypothetical protein
MCLINSFLIKSKQSGLVNDALMQNEISKRLQLCFIIYTNIMNALKIFLSETLELKYDPFDKKIMKIEGHFIFSPTKS